MAAERFVVLGLARPRSTWFVEVGRWAASAAIPVEFLRCVSVEELRSRLGSGRAYSCTLLDGALPAVDRDLLHTVREAGAVPLVVDDHRRRRDWIALGAVAVLPGALTREVLLDALATHAPLVGDASPPPLDEGGDALDVALLASTVAVVCGPGGTGATTVAAALAQGLAEDSRGHGPVLLADLARHAEQAMVHDVRDVAPGLQELAEAHRGGVPTSAEVASLTFAVVERGYHLLLGLRRAHHWAAIRPRALVAAFVSMRRAFPTLVCDVTADFEGEDDAGSADVEDRNVAARTAALAADVVFVVGRPGCKGVHALVRVLADLASLGVAPARLVPVVNLAPRDPRVRAELTGAIADLATPALGGRATAGCVFLPARRVEEALRDAVRLPAPLAPLLAGAFWATLERTGPGPARLAPEPVPVAPGSMGSWADHGS